MIDEEVLKNISHDPNRLLSGILIKIFLAHPGASLDFTLTESEAAYYRDNYKAYISKVTAPDGREAIEVKFRELRPKCPACGLRKEPE
jgi:hypothetical protein